MLYHKFTSVDPTLQLLQKFQLDATKERIWHVILYAFNKGYNATVESIPEVYGQITSASQCQT